LAAVKTIAATDFWTTRSAHLAEMWNLRVLVRSFLGLKTGKFASCPGLVWKCRYGSTRRPQFIVAYVDAPGWQTNEFVEVGMSPATLEASKSENGHHRTKKSTCYRTII